MILTLQDPIDPSAQPAQVTQQDDKLERLIRDRSAKLGVIGLGNVGLPLALELARQNFPITGVDLNGRKVELINAGTTPFVEQAKPTLEELLAKGSFRATQSFAAVDGLDAVVICVSTPVKRNREPDLSYLIAAAEAVRSYLKNGQLIILQCDVSPGTTRDVVLPILERTGLVAGKDFNLAYAACADKREYDNANAACGTSIVGGVTARCASLAAQLLGHSGNTIPLNSLESAEMAHLLERTYRSVGIALNAELTSIASALRIDLNDVLSAVRSTISAAALFDPQYRLLNNSVAPDFLICKSRNLGYEPRLLDAAVQIHSKFAEATVVRIADALNQERKSLNGSSVLMLGVRKHVSGGIAEGNIAALFCGLQEKGATVFLADPSQLQCTIDGAVIQTPITDEVLQSMDCVVLLTRYDEAGYRKVVTHCPIVIEFC